MRYEGDFCCEHKFRYEFGLDNTDPSPLSDYRVLYAEYSLEDYDGQACVLLMSFPERKPYFIEASHCSCYSLNECWDPQPICRSVLVKKRFWGNGGTKAKLLEAYDKQWPNEGDDDSEPAYSHRSEALDINARRKVEIDAARLELSKLKDEYPELFVDPLITVSNSLYSSPFTF